MAVAYGHVTREQRYTADDPCLGCGGYDSRRLGHARCWGVRTSNGQGFTCTVASSGHPVRNGDGWVHLYVGCDCGVDHIEQYQPRPLQRRSPDAPAKVTSHWKTKVSDLGQPEYTHAYSTNLRLLRWGSGEHKTFFWIHFDRDYGWVDGMGGYTAGFYCADEIAAADPRKPVYLAGGEKCVDELVKVGAVAGCNPHGENGQLSAEWIELLRGRTVIILADADDKGRKHAQAIAKSLAGVAASVRILELEGAHDVADWLADGHTLLELLEIIACSPPLQNSNPALQDGPIVETLKTENAKLRQQLQIAETSLAHLRRRQAMAERIMALPKEKLSPPLKPAAIAVQNVLTRPRGRDEAGMEQVYRAEIARQCGVSDKTAGAYLRDLASAGIIHREVRKSFDRSEIFISEGPLFEQPEAIETPERAYTWGGKRVKRCTSCGSANLEVRIVCRDCGEVLSRDDVNKEDPPQEEAQPTPPPPDTRVSHLAADDGPPVCPICGRTGDELRDYGDGLRCFACDVPVERQVRV